MQASVNGNATTQAHHISINDRYFRKGYVFIARDLYFEQITLSYATEVLAKVILLKL